MSDDCIACSQPVRPRQEAISCDGCQLWQHRTCNTGISRTLYRNIVREKRNIAWKCLYCVETDDEQFDTVHESDPVQPEDDTSMEDEVLVNEPDSATELPMEVDDTDNMQESFHAAALFEVPTPIQEDSITEEQPDVEASFGEMPVVYELVANGTARGKSKLVDNRGYSYTLKKQKDDNYTWRCTIRREKRYCPATVLQHGDSYTSGRKEHIHPPNPGSSYAVKLKAEVKTNAQKSIFTTSAANLVESALRDVTNADAPPDARPNPATLTRMANKVRQKMRPAEPKDLDFELDKDYMESNLPELQVRDVYVGGRRHLICTTQRQVELLTRAKVWYMDGTFKVVNDPWYQLFSIHAFIRCDGQVKQIPLVFVFMAGKRSEDYYQVFRALDHMLNGASVQSFVADFELGLWKALRERYPDVAIQGCAFHWAQAVFRKIKECGFQKAYYQKGDAHNFFRQLMALPFLPAEHIRDTFHHLDQQAPESFAPVLDYVYDTWIRGHFHPSEWSVFMVPVRTNNDVEGYHNRLNTRLRANHRVPFYLLLSELYAESMDIPMQVRLLSEAKLQRTQRKTTRTVQGLLFSYWDLYIQRELSTTQLLRKCATVYSPSEE